MRWGICRGYSKHFQLWPLLEVRLFCCVLVVVTVTFEGNGLRRQILILESWDQWETYLYIVHIHISFTLTNLTKTKSQPFLKV